MVNDTIFWQSSKRSFYALISILLLCLLAYNSFTIFCTYVPFPAKTPPEPASFLPPENVAGKSRKFFSVSSSAKLLSDEQHSVETESPGAKLKTHMPLLQRFNANLMVHKNRTTIYRSKRRKNHRRGRMMISGSDEDVKQFEATVMEFFQGNSPAYLCKFRFFMTWISSAESFGERELFSVGSLFKSHPNGCLLIASNSLDSINGIQILRPFSEKGFKVAAISPDYDYLFKNTSARSWYNRLMRGNVNPGEVSLGQNLSNLLRMGLLYRFGGIYIDTDMIVLKSFGGLKNVLGAQTVDLVTRKWSRLNNAVMIFDEGHPLLHDFIEEFALTFDGNKWGHNGPYLVSRVVSRVIGRVGYNFTVLPPMAFYPVDWRKIGSLFHGPKSSSDSERMRAKLGQIRRHSFAVHLWNKQSRRFEVEKGSIVQHILLNYSVICNSSSSSSIFSK